MSAVDHLSGFQFKFTAATVPGDNPTPYDHPMHRVDALNSGGYRVGRIFWEPHNGRVEGISVDPDRRRQGIATRLWHEAHASAKREGVVPPVHSDVQFPEGKAWAAGMTNRPRGATTRKPKAAPSADQAALF